MCGCKKNTQNLVQQATAKVMGLSAQSVESTIEDGVTIQFVGAGSNLLFYGSGSDTRYYFSTGDLAVIDPRDADAFLRLKHAGKNLFTKVEQDKLLSAIEAGEIMNDLEKNPNSSDAVVDQTGYTEDSYEETLPSFDESELLPKGEVADEPTVNESEVEEEATEDELPVSVDEDGNEETTVKVRKPRKPKKTKNDTEEE